MDKLEGVALHYTVGFWDGPLIGMARYQGRIHWFVAEDEVAEERTYRLYKLDDVGYETEEAEHRRFEEHVGTHCCQHLPKNLRSQRPRELHQQFYSQKNQAQDRERRAGYLRPEMLIGQFTNFDNRFS